MIKSDVLIIGSGMAGLFAACVAAEQGKSVQVLAYGGGTLKVAGGTIEVLGYDDDNIPIKNPIEGIKNIQNTNNEHPYAKVGSKIASKALEKFLDITKQMDYPYEGTIEKNQWIPTSVGNFKPSCLLPKTMNSKSLFKAENILVVEFHGMKDFYAHLVVKNLKQRLPQKNIQELTINLNLEINRNMRDASALDIARFLETGEGRATFIEQVRPKIADVADNQNTVIVLPPVLGVSPNYKVWEALRNALGCDIVEVSSIPPAVTGIRLEKMLMNYAKQHNVRFVQKARVVSAEIVDGKCISVSTEGFDRQRKFYADNFILATGGIYGGGLIAGISSMTEPILGINIPVPENQTEWSHQELFTKQAQPFSKFGVNVDKNLNPLNSDGKKIADNVKVVGKTLAGYDFCSEKSGNGVALITAYKAATEFCQGD